MLSFVQLRSRARRAFEADGRWRDEAYRTWRCQCTQPKPGHEGAIDVVVANPRRRTVVDSVSGFSGFAVVAMPLVERIGRDAVESHFHVGKVYTSAGALAGRYVTLRAKEGLVYVRGDERSLRRVCPQCNRLVLGAAGPRYLCGIDGRRAMLQTTFGDLLLRSDYFDSVLASDPPPVVELRRLPVKDHPSDGLPMSIAEATHAVARGEAR